MEEVVSLGDDFVSLKAMRV